jgi:hypothetical protein
MLDRYIYILVGGSEHGWIMTFDILGMSPSQLTIRHISEGWLNHQPIINLLYESL